MVGAAVAVFAWIRYEGERLVPPAGLGVAAGAAQEQLNTLLHVLLALAVVIVTARGMGAIFKFPHQPPVIGEVIGGILTHESLDNVITSIPCAHREST